jgi:NADH:ubiquinone reductase (H+-translocating)
MKLRRHVVVVGGGFGGLTLTKELRRADVHVTLVDRSNHHLFQPLLYQVAMAGLTPAEIAVPIRRELREQQNARVILAEVSSVELEHKRLSLHDGSSLHYDYLVLAPGAVNTYFGHDDWAPFAPGLKDLDDAVEIRRRVLLAFEAAEREGDPIAQRRHLTFVVIGGGPTGVELAGAIAELAVFVLSRDFRTIRPDSTRVVLVEAGPRILSSFSPKLSESATKSLQHMGVDVRLGQAVTAMDQKGVTLGKDRLESSTVLWAAGVKGVPLLAKLGVPLDRAGRVKVEQDCSLPGHPDVFCIGDAACFVPAGREQPLPGTSPVAMQQGRFVARAIRLRCDGEKTVGKFRYLDKGSMATIGRSRAVAQVGRIELSGFVAWMAWLLVHIYYLINFRNRLFVLFDWAMSYFAYERGSRLITGHRLQPGAPAELAGKVAPAAPALPTSVP